MRWNKFRDGDMNIKEKISGLPTTSGVYLMKDAAGEVLYVGKAVSLKKRVQSYFRGRRYLTSAVTKTDVLVDRVRHWTLSRRKRGE